MIMEMYFPTVFMEEVTNKSYNYVDERSVLELNIQIWYWKHISALFTLQQFYHLLDFIFYISVICLPCKIDYWKYDNNLPYHKIMHETGMSRDQSAFIWRYFCIYSVDL